MSTSSFGVWAYSFSVHSLAKPDPPCAYEGLALLCPDYSTHVVLTISGHELIYLYHYILWYKMIMGFEVA